MPRRYPRIHLPPISPAASATLYEQIVEGVKSEVATGRLRPHSPLPSFRELAEELLVSVITVKRAYEELERDGIIYRRQGLGTFVAENGIARSREVRRQRIIDLLHQAVEEAREAGLNRDDLFEYLHKLTGKKEE